MTREKREYGRGTWLDVSYPWGVYVKARAICSDGVVRNTQRIALSADTFFSVPASVQVKGKEVSGYVTVETEQGFSHAMNDDPAIVKFVAYTYRKNAAMLPEGAWKKEVARG